MGASGAGAGYADKDEGKDEGKDEEKDKGAERNVRYGDRKMKVMNGAEEKLMRIWDTCVLDESKRQERESCDGNVHANGGARGDIS